MVEQDLTMVTWPINLTDYPDPISDYGKCWLIIESEYEEQFKQWQQYGSN